MYAIRHKATRQFVTGTDFSRQEGKYFRQFVCSWPMKVYEKKSDAVEDFRHRKCGKNFEIVEVTEEY